MSSIKKKVVKKVSSKSDKLVVFKDRRKEIEFLHKQIESSMIGAANVFVSNAIKIGGILAEVKKSLPHGEFISWIESNISFGHRTAVRYIKIFLNKDSIEKEGFASMKQALMFLSASDSETIEEEVSVSVSELRKKLKLAIEAGNTKLLNSKERAKLRKDLLDREKTIIFRKEKLESNHLELKKQIDFIGGK